MDVEVSRLLIFGLLSLLALSAPTEAEVVIKTSVTYYQVSGERPSDIRAQMRRSGIGGYFGYTRWTIHRHYVIRPTRDGCKLLRPRITLKAAVFLPKLTTRKRLRGRLAMRWDRFASSLARHEMGHVLNGQRTAIEIDRALNTFSIKAPCSEMEAAVDVIVDRLKRIGYCRDRLYDLATIHGTRQGVVFY